MIRRNLLFAAAAAGVLAGFGQASAQVQDVLGGAPASATHAIEAVQSYEEGARLLGEEKYAEAVSALNNALRIESGNYPEAHLAKGHALKAMEDYSGAANAYSQVLQYDSSSAEAYNGRGECYMESSPPVYDLALSDFQNALNLNRTDPTALSNLGHVLVAISQSPLDAIRVLDEALELRSDDARAFRDRGLARAMLREFDKAILDLNKAVELNPTDYENYGTLATIYQIQEEYGLSVDALTKAIENYAPKKEGEPETYISGYIFRADARLRLAETTTNQAERTAALEGAIAGANSVLDLYDDRFPESGYALFRRGRAERMLERYADAITSFKEAIQLVPPAQDVNYLSDAYLYRGICWYYIGSLDLARGDFEQASSMGGGFQDPRVYLWIGFTYHRQENYRQAIDYYSQAIAKSPLFALAHVNKGRAYMDLREYNKAIESFNNAIRSEPDVGDHYYMAGRAYIQLADFQKAVDFLNLALRQRNPKPEMYRAMAEALRGLGRNELADQYERQAGGPARDAGAARAEAVEAPAVQ
jgi:tetratricopeptide (TPR) repeat protein